MARTTDSCYTGASKGWLYLAVVLDLFSRRVVGGATSDCLKPHQEVEALRRALVARNDALGPAHHSDRGSDPLGRSFLPCIRTQSEPRLIPRFLTVC